MNKLFITCILCAMLCAVSTQFTAQAGFLYSSNNPHEHTLTKYEAVAPDDNQPGNIEYYYCEICDKYFLDDDGKIEITKEQTVPVNPEIIDYTALEWKVQSNVDIIFSTNVPSVYFESVSIDGNKLQKEEYLFDEDEENIVVTIKARSFAQLNEGNHRLYIDTLFGTAQIDFKVVPSSDQPPVQPDETPLDFGQIVLIVSVSMLAVICVVLSVMYFIAKRKNDN